MAEIKNKQVVLPRKLANKAVAETPASSTEKGQEISRSTFEVMNQDISVLRQQGELVEAIRQLIAFEGTSSSAVFGLVEIAHTGFKVKAYNTADHSLSPEGIQTAKAVLASMDTLYDYSKGYADKRTISNVIETSLLETAVSGACCMELVLDKQRLPDRVNVVAYDTLRFRSRGDGTKYPAQRSSQGDDIELDYPTFFISEIHKFANAAYVRPMFEPALNDAFHYEEFIQDMRRVVRRSGGSRLVANLVAEQVKAAAPPEVQNDPKELLEWMEKHRSDVESVLSDLNPEDAIVTFDVVKTQVLKTEGEKSDYVPLMNAISGNLATSLKTSPSIIGLRINGSQSLSNTESLVYLKVAKSIQKPVADNMSRLLTLACRLYGLDVYVKFEFDSINLRPEDELAAFRSMQMDNLLKMLSYGFISDEQFAVEMGTGERPAGAPPLSGTLFMVGGGGINAEDASPNADPQGRALQPDTPTKAGGDSQ